MRSKLTAFGVKDLKAVLGMLALIPATPTATRGAEDTAASAVVPMVQMGNPELSPYFFTTKAYQEVALQVFVEEANRVALDLGLPEQMPITPRTLVEIYIASPGSGMLGTISTTNYAYYVRAGRKFAGLDRRDLNGIGIWQKDRHDYMWPISRMDTNRALQMATQIMSSAGLDVDALNHDCDRAVSASMPDGAKAKYFVPDYFISWKKQGESVAFLVFLEPTKSIRTLQVYNPVYMLRKPVQVPNMAELLRPGNAPRILLEKMGLEPTNAATPTNDCANGKPPGPR